MTDVPEINLASPRQFVVDSAAGSSDAEAKRQVVEVALRSVPAPVQVAAINDRVFLVDASLGLCPDLPEDREA